MVIGGFSRRLATIWSLYRISTTNRSSIVIPILWRRSPNEKREQTLSSYLYCYTRKHVYSPPLKAGVLSRWRRHRIPYCFNFHSIARVPTLKLSSFRKRIGYLLIPPSNPDLECCMPFATRRIVVHPTQYFEKRVYTMVETADSGRTPS